MTEHAVHPVQLEQVFFVRFSVIAVPDHVPTDGQISASPINKISINKIPDQPRKYTFEMRTQLNEGMDKASPYAVDVECIAVLSVDETLDDADTQKAVTITGHSVVFGAIREAVSWMTGRQAYGPLLLGLSVLRPTANPDKEKKE